MQNNKKTLGTEFVGYKYNIENKSDSNIEVYIKYATVGDYTDKFNLDEQIPKGKKANGFACLQKTNSRINYLLILFKVNYNIKSRKFLGILFILQHALLHI